MRPSLILTGIITGGLGLSFYVLEIPVLFTWSFPFMIGGLVFVAVGAFAKETLGHIEPPDGYVFCVFCNAAILVGTRKCERCNGVQPS